MDIISKPYSNNLSCQGRCVQIRDAQWVCHKVNTEMPYTSISRFKPLIIRQMNKLERHYHHRDKTTISTSKFINNIKMLGVNKEDLKSLNFLQRMQIQYKQMFSYTEEDKRIARILNKMKDFINNFYIKRGKCVRQKSNIMNSLNFMQECHLANCKETANIAELILKINGIKNAETVFLKAKHENVTLDHAICIFNRNNSPFSYIKKDTIVVDPWCGKADFAHNMIKYYQNQCSHLFRIPKGQKIEFLLYTGNSLSTSDIKQFRTQYPEFIFNNPKRKFMCNSTN